MNPNPNFSQWIARRPPQNPLGIIALFIILVEVIAGTVFGTSSTHLTDTQKLPFIYFLVIFPVVVFTVFTWLVIYHREKLYAPRDFLNPEVPTLAMLLLSAESSVCAAFSPVKEMKKVIG